MRQAHDEHDADDGADLEEAPPPGRGFRRTVRLFSLGLYFMMLVTAVSALVYAGSQSSKLKKANEEIAALREDNRLLRLRLAEALEGAEETGPVERPQVPVHVPIPAPTIAAPIVPPKAAGGAAQAENEMLRRELEERELKVSLLQARNAELERAMQGVLGTHPIADSPAEAARRQELAKRDEAWRTLLGNPGDAEAKAVLGRVLAAMSDESVLIWMDSVQSDGAGAPLLVLDLVRIRAPVGGDLLARRLLRRASEKALPAGMADAVLGAAEGYRTDAGKDVRFLLASSPEVEPEARARALFSLAQLGDGRAAELMGDVFNSLPAGAPQRIEMLRLSGAGMECADAVLTAFADRSATEAELQAAATAARGFSPALRGKLGTLRDTLRERGYPQERLALIDAVLSAGNVPVSPEGESASRH